MGSYHYFIASLPMLRFGQKAPLESSRFIEDSLRLTAPSDHRDIARARLFAPDLSAGNSFFAQYQQHEFSLRNELARARGKRLNRDSEPFLRRDALNPGWASRLRDVLDEPSPLEAEIALLQMIWSVLDHLAVGHYFDTEFLILYHLKLQILERIASFDPEIGQRKLESILNGETQHG